MVLLKQTSCDLLLACDIENEYKPLINQLSIVEGVTKVSIKAWGAIAKRSLDAVIELDV
jgi:hypothetical protein